MGQVGWIKLNIGIFSNRKIKILLREREGDTYFRIWIQILTIAGECNRDGGLYISDNTPFKIKDFTNIIGKSSKTFTKILQKFIDLGMLIYKNDTYFVKNWSKYQSADKLKKIGKSNKVIEEKIKKRISHIVVMGIGEPFDNYDNIMKFINDDFILELLSILTDKEKYIIYRRYICI